MQDVSQVFGSACRNSKRQLRRPHGDAEGPREPEVGDLQVAVRADQQVLRLQVPVKHLRAALSGPGLLGNEERLYHIRTSQAVLAEDILGAP